MKFYGDDDQIRYAALFTAAPDMLAALETILARLGTDPMQDDELAETCRAAIRKARNQNKGE